MQLANDAVRRNQIEERNEKHVEQSEAEEAKVHTISQSLTIKHETVEKVRRHSDEEQDQTDTTRHSIFKSEKSLKTDNIVRVIPWNKHFSFVRIQTSSVLSG